MELNSCRYRCLVCMVHVQRQGKHSPWHRCVCGRIWRADARSDIQPFRKCRKGIPFSAQLCESETAVCTMDGDRKWSIYCWKEQESCEDHRVTVGKIVDYGLKDSQNMGACMAPAACDTIIQNLEDFERKEEDYDRIITGDLGYVGQSILFDLMREKEYDIKERHMDCGMTIFDQSRQDTHAGGSGCGCAAATLSAYILPAIASGEWKRVLFVPTGALMSTVSYNEGASVPGIAHGIVLEHC